MVGLCNAYLGNCTTFALGVRVIGGLHLRVTLHRKIHGLRRAINGHALTIISVNGCTGVSSMILFA